MMRSKEALKSELQAAGLVFNEFSIVQEGSYTAADADWNYKDVPHLSFMHPGVKPVVGIVNDDTMITINMQKLLGLWLPMAVVNYHASGQPQTYFTTWFFFVLIVTTSYEQLEPLRCRVVTNYAIGAHRFLAWVLPIIRLILKRNNDWLMEGDVPMRMRRGQLRARGYKFSQRETGRYTFAETVNIGRNNVTPPDNLKPAPAASIDIDQQLSAGRQYLHGDSGHFGLQLLRLDNRILVFPRLCPHEGASLDDRPCENGRIKCEWHGRIFSPLAEFDLSNSGPEMHMVGAYVLSREGAVLTIKPRAVDIGAATVSS